MAALGLALFTISSPATGHPVPPVPTAGFHDVFALTGPARRGRWQLSRPLPVRPAQMNSRGDLDDS